MREMAVGGKVTARVLRSDVFFPSRAFFRVTIDSLIQGKSRNLSSPTFFREFCVTGHKNACIVGYIIDDWDKRAAGCSLKCFWKQFFKWWVRKLTCFQPKCPLDQKWRKREVWKDALPNSLFLFASICVLCLKEQFKYWLRKFDCISIRV